MPQPETLRELRRGQIVAVARKIIAEDGLQALTIGMLESRLAFSRGVITYHFRNKDDIVRAVLDSAVEEINAGSRARLGAAATPEERVRAVVEGYVRGFIDHVEATRVLISFWGRQSHDRTQSDLFAGYRRGAAALIAEVAPEAPDAEAMGAVMVGVVIGLAVQAYLDPDGVDVEAAIQSAAAAVVARLR